MFLRIALSAVIVSSALGLARAQPQSSAALPNFTIAVTNGDVRMATSMLDNGFPINARNARGETPLLLAVAAGQQKIAELLIARGADINAPADNKDTPWLLAGARGRTAMLEAMLPRGPDYSLRNRFGGSALVPACHYGHVDTVRFLTARTKIDVDLVNNLGWTCLLEAVLLGDGGPAHQEIVRIALKAGANPNLADKDGVSPLTHARRRGQSEVAGIIEGAGGK